MFMAKNRSMERLRIKVIKQSKARPRTLRFNNGHQKVHQSVDRSKVPAEFQGLFEYRTRAKGLLDPYLEAIFPGSTRAASQREQYLDNITEEPDRQKGVILVNGRLRKVIMRFNPRMDWIEIMEYQAIPNLLRVSITYNNYDRAMECYAGDSIRWKTYIQLGVEQAPPE
jgi:hypothetical protein